MKQILARWQLVVSAAVAVLCSAAFSVARPSEQESAARIGGQPAAFGVKEETVNGIAAVNSRLIVRWESADNKSIVTSVAESWTGEMQQDFLGRKLSLHSVATDFMRRWGPIDAEFVSQSRHGVGGTAIFAYRSETIRAVRGKSSISPASAGDVYIVIVLDSAIEDMEVPVVASDFLRTPKIDSAMFTVALVTNQPWGGK